MKTHIAYERTSSVWIVWCAVFWWGIFALLLHIWILGMKRIRVSMSIIVKLGINNIINHLVTRGNPSRRRNSCRTHHILILVTCIVPRPKSGSYETLFLSISELRIWCQACRRRRIRIPTPILPSKESLEFSANPCMHRRPLENLSRLGWYALVPRQRSVLFPARLVSMYVGVCSLDPWGKIIQE